MTLESELSVEELDYLTSSIQKNAFKGKHLEIGTAAGGTLWQMAKAVHSIGGGIVTIDPMTYFPNQLEAVKKNLRDHGVDPSNVDIRVARSNEAFDKAVKENERFDFIFIDASHKIKYVMEDLRWARLLNAGGMLLLHDYCPNTRGVMWAADRFLKRNSNYTIEARIGNLLALKKKATSSKAEVSSSDQLYALVCSPVLQWEESFRKWKRKAQKR